MKKEINDKIKESDIEFIRLQFTDIFGKLKNMSIPVEELDNALDGNLMFDGSSIDGFARVDQSDQCLVPDPSTFQLVPWRSGDLGVARMFCDVYTTEGKPFEGCPRYILKQAIKEAEEMGYDLNVGPEGEFFLFYLDEKGRPLFDIHDRAGYFDLSPTDKGEDARKTIMLTMKKMGFKIEAAHHEVAHGQHEISFKFGKALETADNWMTFKDIVYNVAKDYELYATFIPKPFATENGNAMHCNQSLFKDNENVFYDPNDDIGLSQTARYYIGGLLKHAKGIAAICNPIVNSYKRLLTGYEAPTNIAWSTSNRSTLIRIPASRGNGTRVELRNPDPTANPYLVFAVMLRAGLEGIKNKIEPPNEIDQNLYNLSAKEQEEKCIERLPRDLYDALQEMKNDKLVKKALGNHVYSRFLSAKEKEWEKYNSTVHAWEIKEYLENY